MQEKYFAASNSSEGFCSYYGNVFDINRLSRIYAIKGGSGTGKAFFMKEIAKAAEKRGYSVRYIYCSSDADSLDGIIIKEPKIAVLDGTAPHVYEPQLVGALDIIVDLGAFLDHKKLCADRAEIEKIIAKKQAGFLRVYKYLSAYRAISENIDDLVLPCINIQKLDAFTNRIVKQIDREKGSEEHLLANSVGMRGITHFDTYFESTRVYYSIRDQYDTAHILLDRIYSLLKDKGTGLRISNNPIINTRLDALCVTRDDLTFEIANDEKSDVRVINMARFIDTQRISKTKEKYRRLKKIRDEMLDLALAEFEEIKDHHFKLEKIYGAAMDFDKKEQFTREFCNKIFENN